MMGVHSLLLNKILSLQNTPVERWEEAQFLHYLEPSMKEELAECFDKMARYVIERDKDDTFEKCALPITRRILGTIGSFNGDFSPEFIDKEFCRRFNPLKEQIEQSKKMFEETKIDVEAEIMCAIAGQIASKIMYNRLNIKPAEDGED